MITKKEARKRLLHLFGSTHTCNASVKERFFDVEGFLSKFSDNHTWRDEDLFPEFINYCNSLGTNND